MNAEQWYAGGEAVYGHGVGSKERELVALKRDCPAIAVPTGETALLPEGSVVEVVQALGGSYTVQLGWRLFRIDGADGDALGKPPRQKPVLPENASDEEVERLVWEQLRSCYDPEIPVNIVDLGLVYACEVVRQTDGSRWVRVAMTLTAPACGMGPVLTEEVRRRVLEVPTVKECEVELVFDPPWDRSRMSEAAQLALGVF
ncbi:MAG: putative Fe-S cluster assembly protein SufT [Hydrogenophilus sp.]|nr:putative Fe-S cluster assembly protein SufT [Hydrogenophilus sp.]